MHFDDVEVTPPSDRDAELALIGSVLMDGAVLNEVISFLKPTHFYDPTLGGIYDIFCEMWEAKKGVDIVTARREAETRKFGKAVSYMKESLEIVTNPQMAAHYGKIVMEMSHLRTLRQACMDARTVIEEHGDPRSVAKDLVKAANEVEEQASVGTSVVRANDGIHAAIKQAQYETTADAKQAVQMPWALCPRFDMGGAVIRPTDFPIVAARPGVGKTTFALQWAKITAQRTGRPVVYVSLETPARDLWLKVGCCHTGIPEPHGKPLSPEDAESLSKAADELGDSVPLYIIDSPPNDLTALLALMSRLKEKLDPVAFVVDYLGLVSVARAKSKYEEASHCSRTLRLFALHEDVVVMGVHQLSRAMEKERRPPAMSDLRDSGQIEQDATHIVFLHQERVSEESSHIRDVATILAKSRRGGAPAAQRLRLLASISRFTQRSHAEVRSEPA